ncbi:hypothetical protein KAJ27_20745 [bacterium]|nr:hypothetical protein [bacterium]
MVAELHFLNVKHGDCTWIKHADTKNTVIDVFNARSEIVAESAASALLRSFAAQEDFTKSVKGNFNQKKYPVNPIEYLNSFSVSSVFRYIQTHPDMDHMGGIKDFFKDFSPVNFWDTDNKKEMGSFQDSPYSEEDWIFYKDLRSGSDSDPKRLCLFSGSYGQFFNQGEGEDSGGNGLYLLAPTKELVQEANDSEDFNDCSYVILFRSANGQKVVIGGDSHDKTWEYILEKHENDVKDADLFIAPHHGRKSGRNYDFLDIVNPKLTFFGNANSEHLAYDSWNNRGLEKFTNNQGNCLLAKFENNGTYIYCTYKTFAEAYAKENGHVTYYDTDIKGYFLKII